MAYETTTRGPTCRSRQDRSARRLAPGWLVALAVACLLATAPLSAAVAAPDGLATDPVPTDRVPTDRVPTDLGDYRCSDTSGVYYGNARLIRRPCEISADEVYRQIPEYQEILQQGLTEEDVRYHFLMKKASARFAKAVKEMARAHGYDFVAEIGTIQLVDEEAAAPPVMTSEVIDRLS